MKLPEILSKLFGKSESNEPTPKEVHWKGRKVSHVLTAPIRAVVWVIKQLTRPLFWLFGQGKTSSHNTSKDRNIGVTTPASGQGKPPPPPIGNELGLDQVRPTPPGQEKTFPSGESADKAPTTDGPIPEQAPQTSGSGGKGYSFEGFDVPDEETDKPGTSTAEDGWFSEEAAYSPESDEEGPSFEKFSVEAEETDELGTSIAGDGSIPDEAPQSPEPEKTGSPSQQFSVSAGERDEAVPSVQAKIPPTDESGKISIPKKETPPAVEKTVTVQLENNQVLKFGTVQKEPPLLSKQKAGEYISRVREMATAVANGKPEVVIEGTRYSLPRDAKSLARPDRYGITTYQFEIDGQRVEYNDFAERAYHGVKPEDVIKRQQLISRTARHIAAERLTEPKQLMAAIDALDKKFKKDQTKWAVPTKTFGIRSEDDKALLDSYKDILKKAQKASRQYVRDICYLIEEYSGKPLDTKELQSEEKQQARREGRPIVINRYLLSQGEKTGVFVDMQVPTSSDVVPSTVRNVPKPPNSVISYFGKEVDGQAYIVFKGWRHASYPLLGESDPKKRQEGAKEVFKEHLTNLAKDHHGKEKGTQDDPYQIHLRTMMLLTPINLDPRGTQAENPMLQESYEVLEAFNGKSIQITIDGKKVWVKPDIVAMNLGANFEASRGKTEAGSDKMGIGKKAYKQVVNRLGRSKFQRKINARGFEGFCDDLYGYFKNTPFAEDFKELERLERGAKAMQQDVKDRQYFIAHRKHFKANSEEILKKRQEILNKIQRSKLPAPQKAQCQLMLMHGWKAQNIFINKDYLKPKYLFSFQSRFIHVYSLMGYPVEYFCKSAEDRTGRVDNRLRELIAYELLENDVCRDDTKLNVLAPQIHQYSTSQQNTYYNSGARGLQITKEANPGLEFLAETGKVMAKLAKGVYSGVDKLEPSPELLREE